jgi:hypothetical protein
MVSHESAGQVALGVGHVPVTQAYRVVPLPSQANDGQHMLPPPQTFPHPPQLCVELGSTHPPSQKMEFEVQHPPFVHVWSEAQAAPHAPQLAWSWLRSTHVPPHDVVPCGQPQTPPEQASAAEHA